MTEEELMAEQKRLFDNAKNYDYNEGNGGDSEQQAENQQAYYNEAD